jgi:hypothetical protein
MLEEQFVKEIEKQDYNVDCQNGEDLIILKNNKEVARVNAFQPHKMNTLYTPADILKLIVEFSSTKFENRFK